MSVENIPIPPPPPEEAIPQPPILKERTIPTPENASARAYSKEYMRSERTRLAAELLLERKKGRDQLAELRVRIHLLQQKLENSGLTPETLQEELSQLETQRSERANTLTDHVSEFVDTEAAQDNELPIDYPEQHAYAHLSPEERREVAQELSTSTGTLIDADTLLSSAREKISRHYAEAREHLQRRVEQTMLRNKVFFVHTIQEDTQLRHNENSNVSADASFEDDLDIVLALEPSLSASSITPGMDEQGRVSGLWSHRGGVLISGGHIAAASTHDIGTISTGIKKRHAFTDANASAEQIDAVVQAPRRSRPGDIAGYNELVIDNPEISGYFKSGARDEHGTFWMYGLDIRAQLENLHTLYARSKGGYKYQAAHTLFQDNVNRYKKRFTDIRAKGLPFYVMTPDRRFYEVFQVHDNGSLTVGAELTPEQAAHGHAGLPPDKRKEIGAQLLERNLFRSAHTYTEAKQIVEEL